MLKHFKLQETLEFLELTDRLLSDYNLHLIKVSTFNNLSDTFTVDFYKNGKFYQLHLENTEDSLIDYELWQVERENGTDDLIVRGDIYWDLLEHKLGKL